MYGFCCLLRLKGIQMDLAAAVLPLLSNPCGKPLLAECWPLLNTDAAKQNHQWLVIVVMVVDAALKQGGMEIAAGAVTASAGSGLSSSGISSVTSSNVSLAEVYAAVKEHVRLAARVPQLGGWEKWQLSSAVGELQGVGFGEKGLVAGPPAPDVAALSPEEQQQAMADWEAKKQELLEMVRTEHLSHFDVLSTCLLCISLLWCCT
jgi:hypothetical protein